MLQRDRGRIVDGAVTDVRENATRRKLSQYLSQKRLLCPSHHYDIGDMQLLPLLTAYGPRAFD